MSDSQPLDLDAITARAEAWLPIEGEHPINEERMALDVLALLGRVRDAEAEVALRLDGYFQADRRALVAEGKAAKLAEALRQFFAEYDSEGGSYAPFDDTEAFMRAALADAGEKENDDSV